MEIFAEQLKYTPCFFNHNPNRFEKIGLFAVHSQSIHIEFYLSAYELKFVKYF